MKIKLTIEYKGTPFHGFQRQDGLPTVQGFLEQALEKICGHPITIHAAGRTDKGVHAKAQVVHFETDKQLKLIRFKDGVNFHTPREIQVLKVEHVDDDFHARFSATRRHYQFRVFNRRITSAFEADLSTHMRGELNLKNMQKAAECLIGELDFSSFRTSECQSSTPMCGMDYVMIRQEGDMFIFEYGANHFLHNMVRILTGTLVDIGRGKLQVADMERILKAKDRTQAAETIPPHGLYFMGVDYQPHQVFSAC